MLEGEQRKWLSVRYRDLVAKEHDNLVTVQNDPLVNLNYSNTDFRPVSDVSVFFKYYFPLGIALSGTFPSMFEVKIVLFIKQSDNAWKHHLKMVTYL